MKQFFLDLLNSEAFWFGVTALLAYLANTIVSRKWVAKLPPTNPVRRVIRALHGFIDKIDPAGALVLLACSSLLLPLCTGCVGTLDDARGRISPALGAPRNTDLSKRCQSLSDREFYLGLTSTAFGATGLGAVVTSIPVDEPKWETTAVIAGASAAAVSVVTGWGAVKSAATYVEEGCAK